MEEKIITLVVLSNEKASILQLLLDREGIESFLEHQNLIQGAVSSGVNVKINANDLQKAIPIVESLLHEKLHSQPVPQKENSQPRILLPVDFSDYSKSAASIAFDLARHIKAEITVFHTYYNPIITTMPFSETFIYDMNVDELAIELQEQAEQGMNDLKEFLDNKNDALPDQQVSIQYKLTKGIAEEEIIRYSNKYQPMMIIMGTRGRDRKAADLIGSVTAEVIDIAKFPVLAVPEDFEFSGFDIIKNILYITNFDDSDFIALDILEKTLRPLGVKIICAHVEPQIHSQWDDVRMEGLKQHLKKTYNETDVICDIINHEDFLVGIESYVQEHHIDIISITARKRSIISRMLNPSIAKKMLFHSTTPLLVFHA